MSERIIVVGGGAAGLMAAGRAAEEGAEVLLLEKMGRVGLKLRITGKGRCNLTNDCPIAEFTSHVVPNGMFLRNGLARFFVPDLVAFFASHGVPVEVERGRRVFPESGDANDVVAALRKYCVEGGVQFRYRCPVDSLVATRGGVTGVCIGEQTLLAGAVILATGGITYPKTGSTGDGYRMARALGHTVAPVRPGLVPLVMQEGAARELQGLSLRNVRASLYQGDRLIASEFGEMLFTHFGVSGPIILTLSMRIGTALASGPLRLAIDLKPALDDLALDRRLQREVAELGQATYHSLLKRLLPRTMIRVFGARSGIPRYQRLSEFTAQQRARVLRLLKSFEFTVVRTLPAGDGIITIGGVDTREIVPSTMASRVVRGLYFAGEIIDVAGDTGGYNLQIAFTTGFLAGESAAHALRDRQ